MSRRVAGFRPAGDAPDGAPAVRARSAVAAGALLAALLLLVPTAGAGQQWLEMTTARQTSGHDRIRMEVVYGAGRLTVGPAEEGLLYRARMRYDAESFRPVRAFDRTGDGARVRLGVKRREGGVEMGGDWTSLDLDALDLEDLGTHGSEAGEMDLHLSRSVPTLLDVRVGAAESRLELGGLPLTGLRLATGASKTTVTFDRPNPSSMEELAVKAGVASLEMRGLGNARAGRIRVENAVGEVVLDFSGRWARDAEASVETGLGSVTLRIPRDLGVELEKNTVLSSFSGLGLEKAAGGRYRTENWDTAEHRLRIEVDAAFGSIEVERAR